MPSHETTRRMAVVMTIHDNWHTFGHRGEDPLHSRWLQEATLWAIGRRDELPPHPYLADGQARKTTKRFQRPTRPVAGISRGQAGR